MPARVSQKNSSVLNLNKFTTVWQDDFTKDQSFNSNLFPVRWGDASEFALGSNGLTITSDGNPAGFETPDYLGPTSSYGYGLYQVTFTMPTNQAAGAYICLWPATNQWPGPEIDLAEQLNGQPYLTVHWMGADGSNQYQSFFFNADLSKATTVAVDWEATSLTFYVNGTKVVQYQAGGSVPIPKDAADGGQNEAFGAGNVGPAGTSLTIQKMSYSVPTTNKASATPASTMTVSKTTEAAQTVALSSATTGASAPAMGFVTGSATTPGRTQGSGAATGLVQPSMIIASQTPSPVSLEGMMHSVLSDMNSELFRFAAGAPGDVLERPEQAGSGSLAGLMANNLALAAAVVTPDN